MFSLLGGRKGWSWRGNEMSCPGGGGLAEWSGAELCSGVRTDSYPGFPTYRLHGLWQITYLYFSSLICKVGAIIVPTNRVVVRVNKLNCN